MSTHVQGLTLSVLADAHLLARAVGHAVTFIDDMAHVVVVVDQAGHVIARPEERR